MGFVYLECEELANILGPTWGNMVQREVTKWD